MMGVFMKLFSLLILMASTVFAAPVPGLLGKWEAENVLMGRGVEFKLDFDFAEDEMEMTVHCYFYDGAYLQTSVRSHVNYRRQDILIRQTQETISNDGYRFCRATVTPSRWVTHFDYHGRMILHMPTPYQAQFRLVRVSDF